MVRLAALLLCAVQFGACAEDPLTVKLGGARPAEGFVRQTAQASDGRPVRFTSWMKYVPEQSKLPLVLVLHGGGQLYPFVGENFLKSVAQPALRDLPAIFIAPDLQSAAWSDPYSRDPVIALLDEIVNQWPVDANRVIVVGYSAGGMGTWAYTEQYPERFRVGIPMAARVTVGSETGPGRVPMLVLHGTGDTLFPYENVVRDVESLRANGADVTLVTIDGASHASINSFVDPLTDAIPWIRERW